MKMSENTKRIFLSAPHMSGREMKYIQEAFAQNWIAPLGPNVDALENELAKYCSVKHAAVLSSGTAAMHLALVMLGIGRGDEVIAQSFTFSATINPIVYVGATPVLIDSELETWNMDPELLEASIKDRLARGKKPKAIIAVHLYGMPSKMQEITEIAAKYKIPLIEDAAEALGSRYRASPLGSFGEMSILSFNGNKIITTSGGGALLSNNRTFVEKARFLSTQARDKAPHYQHSEIGYNYRMSNVLAGIGRGQLEILDERVMKRRENFKFYFNNLNSYPGIEFLTEPGADYYSNYWLTTILIDPEKTGKSHMDIQGDLEKMNIESRPLWKPMHLQPVFSNCPSYLNGNSEYLFSRGLCLPSGTNMSDEDLSLVLRTIRNSITS
jgi:dTDP-4-amino-4,6-dideoxygalactose transaminase